MELIEIIEMSEMYDKSGEDVDREKDKTAEPLTGLLDVENHYYCNCISKDTLTFLFTHIILLSFNI